MRARILQGRPFSPEEIAQILEYCLSDVVGLPALLGALLERLPPHVTLGTLLHWGEFAAVSAAMEHNGVPIDMEIASQLLDESAWAFVRDAIVPSINAQGASAERAVDSVCVGDCAPAGFVELEALRTGLQSLSIWWTTKKR